MQTSVSPCETAGVDSGPGSRQGNAGSMHQSNSVTIQAPRERIFELTSNLENWTTILPHYRYIKFLEGGPASPKSRVEMACYRSGLPLSWQSDFEVDAERMELRFTHLRKWTKGMIVVWTYTETPGGVRVEIMHDLKFRWPALQWLAEPIIGGFFISHVANMTLGTFKEYLEREAALAARA